MTFTKTGAGALMIEIVGRPDARQHLARLMVGDEDRHRDQSCQAAMIPKSSKMKRRMGESLQVIAQLYCRCKTVPGVFRKQLVDRTADFKW